jgi:alkane 1-monooxygenase
MTAWRYSMALLHPLSLALGLWLGGAWLWSTVLLSTLVYPVLELGFMYSDAPMRSPGRNHPPADQAIADGLAVFAALAHLALLAFFLMRVSQGLDGSALVLACYSMGLCSGVTAFTLAHEFMHRRNTWAQMLSRVLLYAANYPWFALQHVRRHHLLVATPGDTASASQGQSVYAFYLRSIGGGLFDCLRSGSARARAMGKPGWSPWHNAALASVCGLLLCYLCLGLAMGPQVLLAFIWQGLAGVLVLETINYIQHYGLQRRDMAERVSPAHSWDCHSPTNYALFNLGLHAQHHASPSQPYYQLVARKQAPQMPLGYFSMAFLALLPPLWRRLMDCRLRQLQPDMP